MNKRGLVFCFGVFFVVLFSLSFVLGEVRINEVMYDPTGNDVGNEWVELYNNGTEAINITGWKFITRNSDHDLKIPPAKNGRGDMLIYPKNYTIICQKAENFSNNYLNYTGSIIDSSWEELSNSVNETLILKNSSDYIIQELVYSGNSSNEGKSLQYISNSWQSCTPTPGYANSCTTQSQIPNCTASDSCSNSSCTNGNITQTCTSTLSNCTNSTTTQNISCSNSSSSTNTSTTTNASISLNITWTNEEIINSNNFSIKIKAFNLLNYTYDIKVWLELKDNDIIISDRYDESEEKWKSGTYFIAGFFSGSGNKTKDINLRLREDYLNFSGEAKIFIKLRKNDDTINEVNYTINILKKIETIYHNSLLTTANVINNISNTNNTYNESGIIKLGSKISRTAQTEDIKTEKSTIYKSKNEYIKEYAIYGFAILCVFLIILLLIDKR